MTVSKFVKSYQIRTYEGDKHTNLRLLTLMNLLQDVADSHATVMGLGYDFCIKHNLAWVAANYHIKIIRPPKIHENITITTWPSEEKKLGAVRDYEVRDELGNVIIQASTQWVLINFETKKPQFIKPNLPTYEIIPEKADNFEFSKIILPEMFNLTKNIDVRFDDIDSNNHVNNAVYPLWASEALDNNFRNTHIIQEMEISFKKPAIYGEHVTISTQQSDLESIHLLSNSETAQELARVKFIWAKI